MKKTFTIILAVFVCSLFFGCSTLENEMSYDELETQLAAVIEERDSLKSEYDALKAELDTLKSQIEAEKKETTVQEGDVTVLVTDKKSIPMDSSQWIFSNYVECTFSITNNTAKDIQGIQGTLIVNDLFGTQIMYSYCNFTGETIPSGGTVVRNDLSIECNPFDNENMRFFNEEFADLQFEYITTQIVFTDGTTKTLNENNDLIPQGAVS